MNLTLKREYLGPTFTVGKLYADGVLICMTIEDKVRQIDGKPVKEWKVQGETAIPRGTYPVTITVSNRFKRELPILGNVEGFDGVRIHTGNTSEDTEGCLIVGTTWDGKSDFIGGSRVAFDKLFPMLKAAKGPITITIT